MVHFVSKLINFYVKILYYVKYSISHFLDLCYNNMHYHSLFIVFYVVGKAKDFIVTGKSPELNKGRPKSI